MLCSRRGMAIFELSRARLAAELTAFVDPATT
jgi:hypothetical protein